MNVTFGIFTPRLNLCVRYYLHNAKLLLLANQICKEAYLLKKTTTKKQY